MVLLLVSFLSGILTVLAPCVLPLLPIIVGGAAQDARRRNPYVITISLAASIVAFTLLLKFSAAFVSVPQAAWTFISGGMLIAFGLVSLFPAIWETISGRFSLQKNADAVLEESAKKSGFAGDVLIGLSLGPVFSSCSPTYFLILATVLPQRFLVGTLYLVVYAVGLSISLLLISLLGRRLIRHVRFLADPNGWFKKAIGVIFIAVGLVIATGNVIRVETWLADNGYPNVSGFEQKLLGTIDDEDHPQPLLDGRRGDALERFHEIANPSGFVNSDPITIGQFVGKKVVLIDFMTYSCINCIRTFPYLVAWDKEYGGQGLQVIGIHTPEFAFEKKLENVSAAMRRFGITFPIVLDNDYGTWNAYENRYWPHEFLIDLEGNVAYDVVGEGSAAETEAKIRELLGLDAMETAAVEPEASGPISPEIYFGSARAVRSPNGPKLDGGWNVTPEAAVTTTPGATALYRFQANQVYLVASARNPTVIGIRVDGVEKDSVVISEERLYTILDDKKIAGPHLLELTIPAADVSLYTFTFGNE